MSTGNLVVNQGRKIMMHRCFDTAPAYTAPNWFEIGSGTTTPALTDTAMATLVQIDGSDTKAVASGYPTFSDANLEVTNRCILLTTESNGNTLTEFGLANNDGTPLLFSRAVYTGIAKTTSVQIIYIQKDKLS